MINSQQQSFSDSMKCVDSIKFYYKSILAFSHSVEERNLASRYFDLIISVEKELLALAGEVDALTKNSESLVNKLTEKELAYDDLIQALLNTEFGKKFAHNKNSASEIFSFIDAVIIIRSLDEQLQRYIELDEIPFGVCESERNSYIAVLENQVKAERERTRDFQLQVLDFCGRITADIAYEMRADK